MSNLNPQQFYSLHHEPMKLTHRIIAHDSTGNEVGTLQWNKQSKRVHWVGVDKEHRRQGIASHMWDYAHQVSEEIGKPGPKHSNVRWNEGDAWAHSVGGNLPENKMKK
jgi:GNAT superfamily N-acetyltransferase